MRKVLRMFTLALTVMVSSAAWAQWTKPVPTGTEMVDGTKYYLYNVGAAKFATQGEAWTTQAVVADEGIPFRPQTSSDYDGYRIHTYGSNGSTPNGEKWWFITTSDGNVGSGTPAIFTDNTGTDAMRSWAITNIGNNVYTIQSMAEAYASNYVGVQTSHASGMATDGVTWGIWPDLTDAEGDYIHWLFVSEDEYAGLAEKIAACNAAEDLKASIDEAKAAGIDVSEEEAVYNNTSSTADQLKAAKTSVITKIANATASPSNPMDMTSYINNPTFDSSISGWTSTTSAQNKALARNQTGDFSIPFYENWDASASNVKGRIYQEISGLPAGYYKFKLAAFANVSNEGVYIYASDQETPMVAAAVNNPKFHTVYFEVAEGQTFEIGLRLDDNSTNNWVGIDNASLAFYGSSDVAVLGQVYDIEADLDNLIPEDDIYASSYYDALLSAIADAKTATTKDAATTGAENVKAALAALQENMTAYDNLEKAMNNANELLKTIENSRLGDDVLDAEDMLGDHEATTEEVNAMIEEIENAISAATHTYGEGDDVTALITNPDFEVTSTADEKFGWKISYGGFANISADSEYGVAEIYHKKTEIYQELTDLKAGVYQLELQAFYRPDAEGANATGYAKYYAKHLDGTLNNLDYGAIFIGENESAFPSIFDGGQATSQSEEHGIPQWNSMDGDIVVAGSDGNPDIYIPNTMPGAQFYFTLTGADGQPLYNTVAKGVCTSDGGTMRVGLRTKDATTWNLWKDFKFTYLGMDADEIAKILEPTIASANTMLEGVMPNSTRSELTSAVETAQKALDAKDGQSMLDAYNTLTSTMNSASSIVEAYSSLSDAKADLDAAIKQYSSTATDEAKTAATALQSEVATALTEGSYTADEATAKIEEIKQAIKNIRINKNASDSNPQDVTFLIDNPDFTDGNNGWDAAGSVNYENMEGYSTSFNYYQDITNAPVGAYKLTCQGYYRQGYSEGAQKAFYADSVDIRAKLYANNDTCKFLSILDGAGSIINEQGFQYEGNWMNFLTAEGDSTDNWFPNNQQAARSAFVVGRYSATDNANTVIFSCTDGNIRIGYCVNENVSGDWTTATNFQLLYYGADSKYFNGITTINSDAKVIATKYFTADGKQIARPVKGLNIIRETTTDGTTRVRKVIIR